MKYALIFISAAPMLAAFLLIPVLDEYGPKYALLLYATVSILSVLLVPELELELAHLRMRCQDHPSPHKTC